MYYDQPEEYDYSYDDYDYDEPKKEKDLNPIQMNLLVPKPKGGKANVNGVKIFCDKDVDLGTARQIVSGAQSVLRRIGLDRALAKYKIYFTDLRGHALGLKSAFRNIILIDIHNRDIDDCIRTIIHEFGHVIQDNSNMGSWGAMVTYHKHKDWRVSHYAHTDSEEMFAELFTHYAFGYDIPYDAKKWMERFVKQHSITHGN